MVVVRCSLLIRKNQPFADKVIANDDEDLCYKAFDFIDHSQIVVNKLPDEVGVGVNENISQDDINR